MRHEEYYDALERLRLNVPLVLQKGTYKINKDTVAIEAGRGRGAIKPSRGAFKDLIKEIEKAAAEYTKEDLNKLSKARSLTKRYKSELEKYREKYSKALNREVMLVKRLGDLENKVNQLIAEKKIIHLQK